MQSILLLTTSGGAGCAAAIGARRRIRAAKAAARRARPHPSSPAPRLSLVVRASAASSDAPPQADLAAERRRGIKTVMGELRGLDMPPAEVLKYAQGAVRLPPRAPAAAAGVPVARAAEALAQIMAASEGGDGSSSGGDSASGGGVRACDDPAALAALNHVLTDLWRWKRRGGGARWDEDDAATSPSAVALLELQGVDVGGKAAAAAEAARAAEAEGGGGFFDAGNLDEREKQELAGMMRGAALAGVQNAFWGSLVLSGLVLLLLNFARG